MSRYFIQLSYNGTRYHGWQVQNNAITVQQDLNNVLSIILGETIETLGCGRTDAGVHAKQFYAHFDSDKVHLSKNLVYKVNQMLGKDISCANIFEVPNLAHARFDAISRKYEYIISFKKDPFLQEFAYFLNGTFDVALMNKACEVLFDYTDFSCFSKSKTQVFTNNCKIMEAGWTVNDEKLIFTIKADRFLRNMVRAIVGTMLDIGRNQITLDRFREILESKNRSNAGLSVPANGLFLTEISYPPSIIIN